MRTFLSRGSSSIDRLNKNSIPLLKNSSISTFYSFSSNSKSKFNHSKTTSTNSSIEKHITYMREKGNPEWLLSSVANALSKISQQLEKNYNQLSDEFIVATITKNIFVQNESSLKLVQIQYFLLAFRKKAAQLGLVQLAKLVRKKMNFFAKSIYETYNAIAACSSLKSPIKNFITCKTSGNIKQCSLQQHQTKQKKRPILKRRFPSTKIITTVIRPERRYMTFVPKNLQQEISLFQDLSQIIL